MGGKRGERGRKRNEACVAYYSARKRLQIRCFLVGRDMILGR